ncbi:MAG: ABC transporter permease [Candidatus Methanoperedens sp.]|nr:ABC transporter permease [Candidatus Methanoperedens sp.]MCE8426962.1 ABC transporter permease [Candidatus Methanoperedens sp.]
MKLKKCSKHAFNMVLHSKLRSWLTITGIVIGVAAVIAIVSIGDGMQQTLNAQLNTLGGDIVTISPGAERGGGMFGMRGGGGGGGSSGPQATTKEIVLGRSDLQALKGLSDIALIDTNIRGSVNISYFGKTGKVSVTGVDQKVWSQITTSTIQTGRTLDSADQNVIVIGGNLASSYFDQPIGINKMVTINSAAFRVVGILDDQTTSVYMPIQMAYQVIPDKTTDIYDTLVVKIKDQNQLDASISNIQDKLMISRHVTQNKMDFSVTSRKEMQQARAATMNSMSTFLLAIAAVSLIVGSIGIANTMFTSVLEKTKEIGIMKAIGARNQDILLIFLFNAAFIGLVGGILGIILGTMLSGFMPALMGGLPMARGTAIVTLNSITMALSVSVSVGILAGIIPAYQASKLKPVDALRYE